MGTTTKAIPLITLILLYGLSIHNYLTFYYNPLKIHALAIALLLSSSLTSFATVYTLKSRDTKFYFHLLTLACVITAFTIWIKFIQKSELVIYTTLGTLLVILITIEIVRAAK